MSVQRYIKLLDVTSKTLNIKQIYKEWFLGFWLVQNRQFMAKR